MRRRRGGRTFCYLITTLIELGILAYGASSVVAASQFVSPRVAVTSLEGRPRSATRADVDEVESVF